MPWAMNRFNRNTALLLLVLLVCCLKFLDSGNGPTKKTIHEVLQDLDKTQAWEEHPTVVQDPVRKQDQQPAPSRQSQSHPEGKQEQPYEGRIAVQKEGPWFLGTCTGTKGSGAWMREWIEIQLATGVDHLWVVNDNAANSSDGTAGVLKQYEELGYVTVIPGTMPSRHEQCTLLRGKEGRHNCAPVKHCFEHASPHVKWLLFADTDEFIFPHNGCSLKEHIKNHCNPDQSHILVRWERFGSNGFEMHPHGLMMENFLSSGGGCAKTPMFDRIFTRGYCASTPYSYCGECRHTKVIYNTECAKLDHAGWIHWPVNTTEWKDPRNAKKPEYNNRVWAKSPGLSSHWKHDKCVFQTEADDFETCNQWATSGGGAKRPREYTPDCCAGGIGYNHYGMKSMQYYARKAGNKADSKRGFRAPLRLIELDSTISFSAVRFLRVLRKRFRQLGAAISDNVKFLDGPSGTCFVEANFKYTPTATTKVRRVLVNTTESCCDHCFAVPSCRGFSVSDSECSLLLGAVRILGTSVPTPPYHLLADRTWELEHRSGIPLREGECLPGTSTGLTQTPPR